MMRCLGSLCFLTFYLAVGFHIFVYLHSVVFTLKMRFGIIITLLWTAVGINLLYHILFNHLFASIIKPGGPKELR